MRPLSDVQAEQFALILLSGCPVTQAVTYFLESSEDELRAVEEWPRQPAVLAATKKLTGGVAWQEMGEQERIEFALKKHYAELAYFIYSTNYNDLEGAKKQKSDTCRQVLETKLAGLAGQSNPLTDFYSDMLSTYKKQVKDSAIPRS